VTGELAVAAQPRARHELKAAIYDGRLETYEYPPLFEEVAAMATESDTNWTATPGPGLAATGPAARPTLVADAVAGVVHVLAGRRESWAAGSRPRLHRPHLVRDHVQRLLGPASPSKGRYASALGYWDFGIDVMDAVHRGRLIG